MEEALNILTRLKIEAHFKNQKNKEAKLDLVIKALKVVISFEKET